MQNVQKSKALISSILAGKTEGFREIVNDYENLVAHIVNKMVPDRTVVEDLCQDVFIKVYQNLGSFKFESKLSTWIARIAYNTTLNYLEKKKVPVFADISDDDSFSADTVKGDSATPEEFTTGRNTADLVREEIDALPPQYGVILALYHLEDMSYDEIGNITGMPAGTVKSHLFRGRKLLKERLMTKYNKEELWN